MRGIHGWPIEQISSNHSSFRAVPLPPLRPHLVFPPFLHLHNLPLIISFMIFTVQTGRDGLTQCGINSWDLRRPPSFLLLT